MTVVHNAASAARPSFAELNLAEPLLKAVLEEGYTTPTPIQAQAIPLVLQGGDLLASAQTGTGKTAGFTLPILHRLLAQPDHHQRAGRPRCLILTPTRELAGQVEESVRTYGRHTAVKSMVMFGGVGINPQIQALKRRVDIVVATPGRLLDHASQKTIDLSGIEILVLDEADRMLDMGFIHDIRKVLALLPPKRQNLLFSATFSDEVKALADRLLNKPGYVEAARRNTASQQVEQTVHLVEQSHKREALAHLIKTRDWTQVLVFTRTKHGANRLAEYLGKNGISAAAIHGNKSQSARTQALGRFKDGSLPVLVATDIAARGLDIDQLPQVVNFELPNVAEDYVHRIGRTGRAGATGAALSLVDREEVKLLTGIEKLIKREIPRLPLDGFVASAKPAADAGSDARGDAPRRASDGSRRAAGGSGEGRRAETGREPRGSAPAGRDAARAASSGRDGNRSGSGRDTAGPRKSGANGGAPARNAGGARGGRDSSAREPARRGGSADNVARGGNQAPAQRAANAAAETYRTDALPAPRGSQRPVSALFAPKRSS